MEEKTLEAVKELATVFAGAFTTVFGGLKFLNWLGTSFKIGNKDNKNESRAIEAKGKANPKCSLCDERIKTIETENIRIQTQLNTIKEQTEQQFDLIREISAKLNRILGALGYFENK